MRGWEPLHRARTLAAALLVLSRVLVGCGAADTAVGDVEPPEVCPISGGCAAESWPLTSATTSPPADTAVSPRVPQAPPTTDDDKPFEPSPGVPR